MIVITVQRAYFQCQKALARSGLWTEAARPERGSIPTAGQMLKAVDGSFDAEGYDANYPQHMKETIY